MGSSTQKKAAVEKAKEIYRKEPFLEPKYIAIRLGIGPDTARRIRKEILKELGIIVRKRKHKNGS